MYLDLIGFISEYTTIGSSNLISVGNREHTFTDRLWKIWYTLINLVLTHSRVLNHLEGKGHIWVSKLWRTKLLPITCSYYLITCLPCLPYIIYCLYIYIRLHKPIVVITWSWYISLRAQQYSSDQKKILKDQTAQTTASVVSLAYCLGLPFLINRVLNLTKLRSVILDQSVDSSCFILSDQ